MSRQLSWAFSLVEAHMYCVYYILGPGILLEKQIG